MSYVLHWWDKSEWIISTSYLATCRATDTRLMHVTYCFWLGQQWFGTKSMEKTFFFFLSQLIHTRHFLYLSSSPWCLSVFSILYTITLPSLPRPIFHLNLSIMYGFISTATIKAIYIYRWKMVCERRIWKERVQFKCTVVVWSGPCYWPNSL